MTEGMPAVADVVRGARGIVVAGHVGPDGDALGSMVALAKSARLAGKDAVTTFGDPFIVPHQLRFLDGDTIVPVGDVPAGLDVLVVVDCGELTRLGSAAVLAERADTVAVIDHHRTHDAFGDVAWIEPEAGATAQMVYHLLRHLDWPIDKPVAEALYTGIVTDTGRFQYSSTTPEVHHIAAELLAVGVVPDELGQRLFAEAPFAYLGAAGAVLSRARLEPGLRLVWSSLTQRDLADAGIGYEEADGLIDLIRVAEEAEVACLLRELEDGRTKGSLRSRGRIDVAAAAQRLGGGGHHNASGFTIHGPIETAIDLVRKALA